MADLTPEGTIPEETFEKGNVHTVQEAIAVARKIGYENGVMIKASEGGGGKGIRLVYNEDDLPDHPSLRRTGWKTLIRDDIDEEFDHLANLRSPVVDHFRIPIRMIKRHLVE